MKYPFRQRSPNICFPPPPSLYHSNCEVALRHLSKLLLLSWLLWRRISWLLTPRGLFFDPPLFFAIWHVYLKPTCQVRGQGRHVEGQLCPEGGKEWVGALEYTAAYFPQLLKHNKARSILVAEAKLKWGLHTHTHTESKHTRARLWSVQWRGIQSLWIFKALFGGKRQKAPFYRTVLYVTQKTGRSLEALNHED